MVDELEAVEALIAEHPEGIRRPELERAFAERYGTSIHWRTLLRRLNRLICEARVRSEGESTARLYLPGSALGGPGGTLFEPRTLWPLDELYRVMKESGRRAPSWAHSTG